MCNSRGRAPGPRHTGHIRHISEVGARDRPARASKGLGVSRLSTCRSHACCQPLDPTVTPQRSRPGLLRAATCASRAAHVAHSHPHTAAGWWPGCAVRPTASPRLDRPSNSPPLLDGAPRTLGAPPPASDRPVGVGHSPGSTPAAHTDCPSRSRAPPTPPPRPPAVVCDRCPAVCAVDAPACRRGGHIGGRLSDEPLLAGEVTSGGGSRTSRCSARWRPLHRRGSAARRAPAA